MNPGEKITKVLLLNDCHNLDRPGTYQFVVFYQDGNPHPPASPAGTIHLSNTLQSETATFEVVGDS